MAIYTAGFAEWTAEQFFGELKQRQVDQLIDVRLNNVSQLAGFAKKKDLEYFLFYMVANRSEEQERELKMYIVY